MEGRQALYCFSGNRIVRYQPVIPARELSTIAYVLNPVFHPYSSLCPHCRYQWGRHEDEEPERGKK